MACLLSTSNVDDHNFPLIDSYLSEMNGSPPMNSWEIDSFDSCGAESENEINTIVADILDSEMNVSFTRNKFSPDDIFAKRVPFEDVLEKYSAKIKRQRKKRTIIKDSKIVPKKERNRLAARRCRKKQKDRIEILENEVAEIEKDNMKVVSEIEMLQQQLRELQETLLNHKCVLQPPLLEEGVPLLPKPLIMTA